MNWLRLARNMIGGIIIGGLLIVGGGIVLMGGYDTDTPGLLEYHVSVFAILIVSFVILSVILRYRR